MAAIVPDTFQGALIISIIDFFLSFVIISGIGVVLALFPVVNRVDQLRVRVAQFRLRTPQAAVAEHNEMTDEDDEAHIAAITAAVYVVMAGAAHRIVHIESPHQGDDWVAEGRLAQHTSHSPVRPPH